MFTCNNPEMMGDGSPQVRLPSNVITFRVDAELPGMNRSALADRVMGAWKRWEAVIGITVDLHTNPKTDPTQIVTAHNFGDGAYGVLADQQLPYGRGVGLVMRIDRASAQLDADSFDAMLTHENGHALGISHSSPSDGVKDLMDPMLQKGVVKPQAGDILVARKMGYGAPGENKPVPSSGPWGRIEVEIDGVKYAAQGTLKKVA